MNPPTDEELRLKLTDTENSFVERKLFSDSKDWLKTVVAFANSTPIDYPAVLFIGVKDNGSPEARPIDLDAIQKSFSSKLRMAYPPIYYDTRIVDVEGVKVLTVIVPGSSNRPHFAGPAFTRDGCKTVVASDEQFDHLIAQRNDKAYKILEWKDKHITFGRIKVGHSQPLGYSRVAIVDCNQHYVTLGVSLRRFSIPLSRIEISFDQTEHRLELVELPPYGTLHT